MRGNVWDPEDSIDDPNSPYNTMLRDRARRGRPPVDQPPPPEEEWHGSPFDPAPPTQGVDPSSFLDSARGMLNRPGARAALLQFGLNLMQPPQPGQNTLAHVGSAIGAGAEAAQRGRKQEADLEREGALSEYYRSRGGAAEETAAARMLSAEARASDPTRRRLQLDPKTGRYRLMSPEVVPGPSAEESGGPFPQTVTTKRSTGDWLKRSPQFWNEVKAGLRSTDPVARRASQEAVARAKPNLVDPDALDAWLGGE